MRVLQVVTLVSSGGSFGGPVTVAVAQTEALQNRNHNVAIAGGWDGFGSIGAGGRFATHLFKVSRPCGLNKLTLLTCFPLWIFLWKNCRQFDCVHVHLGRDLVSSLSAAVVAARRQTFVVQCHGMLTADSRLSTKFFDRLITRNILARAATVFALTPSENATLAAIAPKAAKKIQILRNGISIPSADRPTLAEPPTIVFCSRLHERKRPLAFVQMAQKLLSNGVDARFLLAGPDEGQLASVRKQIDLGNGREQISYVGQLEGNAVLKFLQAATLMVLPSIQEPFPMIVLEAMSLGTPVVLTSSCGIARELDERGAALVSDPDAEALARAVQSALEDRSLLKKTSERGLATIADAFSISAVAEQLEAHYVTASNSSTV